MADSDTFLVNGLQGDEVLTLAEAAAFLRVPEEALTELLDRRAIPAQKIGGEWRFLKRALVDWLRLDSSLSREFGYPLWEEFLRLLE